MAFDLSLEDASELCAVNGLQTPRAIRRINRGEVNAVFEVTFPQRESVILKVGVRDEGPAELTGANGHPAPGSGWLRACCGLDHRQSHT